MILFGELYFFVCAGLLLIPALVLGIMEKPIKYYGFFVTIVFILLALWNKPTEIFYNNNFVPPDKTGKGENAMLVLDFYNVIIGTTCIV